ncbi:MAG TPA: ATP-dependent 6-phosphofructokinase [Candidatus Omnitrophota bacterium]|nr:ATP-dependent 6-phosphofructokinase [Candidatus Omnitrophota bacterium]HRY85145.1 ATP-dependent 6-phosphofructokinase [Candidatus Omnitrophota bacterium]
MKRIGMLTGGGDCPGLNAVLRAIVRTAKLEHWACLGFKRGWKGMIQNDFEELTLASVSGILPRGGTILETSRTNPCKKEEDMQKVRETIKKNKLDALIAIGGEDTLGAANKLFKEGLPIIGVPKTIDNDLNATDYTFGYDTALNIATECIDRLHTTAESHERVMVVEIMGRHAGWIALESGIAGGADVILIPEVAVTADEICDHIVARHKRGKHFSIVAVAEGFSIKGEDLVTATKELDAFGHVLLGGVGDRLAKLIEKKTGYETRCTVLGHIQRGGSPTAFDRVLGTRFGVKAVELVKLNKFGYMVALKGRDIVEVPLADAVGALKTVPMDMYELTKIFAG